MAFFRNLFSRNRPHLRFESLADLRSFIAERLSGLPGVTRIEADPADEAVMKLIVGDSEGRESEQRTLTIALDNLYRTAANPELGDAEFDEVIRMFTASIRESLVEPEFDPTRFFPAVRPIEMLADDHTAIEEATARGDTDPYAAANTLVRPLFADLAILMMQETPNSFVSVPRAQLAEIGISAEEAWQHAYANLAVLAGRTQLTPIDDTELAELRVEDNPWLATSLLLIPEIFSDLMQQNGFEEILVAAPVRFALLLAPSGEEAERQIIEITRSELQTSDHTQSHFIYRFGKTGRFEPVFIIDPHQGEAHRLS